MTDSENEQGIQLVLPEPNYFRKRISDAYFKLIFKRTVTNQDYYRLLGLTPDASSEDIRRAYHRLAKQHHPDRNPGDSSAAERFRAVHEAYQVLSDPHKRAAFDLQRMGREASEALLAKAYLDVEISKIRLRRNEELDLQYAFPAEGRAFRKPRLHGWEICSGPGVSHRFRQIEGMLVRETVLRYTLSPLTTGRLSIPPAHLQYARQPCVSAALSIEVDECDCFFSVGRPAGLNPLRYNLTREQVTVTARFRKTVAIQRCVLVPRSDYAAWYHRVGRSIKVVMALTGIAWAAVSGWSLAVGFLSGTLLGGLQVVLMYRMAGVRSKGVHGPGFSTVIKYQQEGYRFENTAVFSEKTEKAIRRLNALLW